VGQHGSSTANACSLAQLLLLKFDIVCQRKKSYLEFLILQHKYKKNSDILYNVTALFVKFSIRRNIPM
jgi:hypothetical protein